MGSYFLACTGVFELTCMVGLVVTRFICRTEMLRVFGEHKDLGDKEQYHTIRGRLFSFVRLHQHAFDATVGDHDCVAMWLLQVFQPKTDLKICDVVRPERTDCPTGVSSTSFEAQALQQTCCRVLQFSRAVARCKLGDLNTFENHRLHQLILASIRQDYDSQTI